ncbi:MAG: flavodoxin-dependent (E)-4-hydroxy-3-methylbut-2-enyl-diphosphate synthase [Candidatus Omnitrophota bacterium]
MTIKRRPTTQVMAGGVGIGSDFPVAIQSMTNTPTASVDATVKQITQLVKAGSELVRLTVNDEKAAEAIPRIRQKLDEKGVPVPLIGDFHFNGHLLLTEFPEMAKTLSKYRINPGNLGLGQKHDEHFEMIIKTAIKFDKSVRIGVNSGSLDPDLLKHLMNKNASSANPQPASRVFSEAMIISALQSAEQAGKFGLSENRIIISAKTPDVQDLIFIYERLASEIPHPLHIGLTEAGQQEQGIISSAAAIAVLLQKGIGDTIRVSLTPDEKNPRTKEVEICKHILQSLGIRYFFPRIISCPGCGRSPSRRFQHLTQTVQTYVNEHFEKWKTAHPGVSRITIAIMGCVVNGPGESRHADIGISLPGETEKPTAPVYIRGEFLKTLQGTRYEQEFLKILDDFIHKFC